MSIIASLAALAILNTPLGKAIDIGALLQGRGYVTVPLQESAVGHLYTRGILNGREVEILIDTGASNTVIDTQLAKDLGLQMTASRTGGAGIGEGRVASSAIADALLTISGVRIEQQVYAMDLGNVRSALAARGVTAPSVVLGSDAMRALSGILLYKENRLYLLKP